MPFMTAARIPSRFFRLLLALLLFTMPALAKDAPLQVIDWPATGTPVLRFTFSKFRQLNGASNNLRGYVLNAMVENLSSRTIPAARFSVYLFDKSKVRVGEDFITLNNVGSGESVKVEFTVTASGPPASVTLKEAAQNSRTVTLTVNSIPQGAVVKLDQTEVGATPKIINVSVGKHILTFTKEGFTAGTYPLEISPQDVSGGSVSYELGASAFDSIELRDGSVLNGDLVSLSGMDVEIRVGGVIEHIDRNKIKRVMFVQRSAPLPNLPGPVPPSP
jgi:hypothetical protein